MTTPQLRPYQIDLISRIFSQWNHHDRVMGQLATGGGKSVIFGSIASHFADLGDRVLIVAHREELVTQAAAHIQRWTNYPVGIIKAGYPFDPSFPLQVASIQTLVNRLDRCGEFGLVIIDECHHCTATSYLAVLDRYSTAKVLGLTATPVRGDGKGFEDIFDVLECGISTADLIEAGYLSPYRLFASPCEMVVKGARSQMGDFKISDLEQLNRAEIVAGDAVATYRKYAEGKTCITFALSVDHSIAIADAYNRSGIPALHLDAETDRDTRRLAMEQLRTGDVRVISNVGLFGEGVDVPALDAVQICRPTKSIALHLQMLGRVLRVAEGKKYGLILDHAGNCSRLDLPDSIRSWGLDGKIMRDRPNQREEQQEPIERQEPSDPPIIPDLELLEVDVASIRDYQRNIYQRIESKAIGWGSKYLEILQNQQRRRWKKTSIIFALKDARPPLVVWEIAAEYLGYRSGWAWHQWQEHQGQPDLMYR